MGIIIVGVIGAFVLAIIDGAADAPPPKSKSRRC